MADGELMLIVLIVRSSEANFVTQTGVVNKYKYWVRTEYIDIRTTSKFVSDVC